MKFSRTLAAITAAAMAVTMAAIPASAAGTVNGAAELKVPVANFLPEGCDYSQIYGVEITVDEATQTAIADAIEAGHNAGGGLIFNNNVSGWNQAEWALVPDAPEKDLYDAETGTFTRLDAELPFGDDAAAVEYAEVVFTCWWANDGAEESTDIDINFQITGIKFLDAEGNYLVAAETETPEEDDTTNDDTTSDDETVGDSEEVPGDDEPGEDEPGEDEPSDDEPETEGTVALELANGGRTVVDSGLVRTNIINAWTGDEADVLLDKEAFAGANLISVKFTVTGVTEAFDAWLSFADKAWAVQYWGEGNEGNLLADCTVVTIDKDGTYVVTATLEQAIEAMEFIAVCTNLEVEGEESPITITIDELKIDVVELDDEVPGDSSGEPTNPDTGVVLVVVPAALAAAALATSGIVLKKRSK